MPRIYEADVDGTLAIPKEVLDAQRWTFTLGGPFSGQTGSCEEMLVSDDPRIIRLTNVLLDISTKRDGIVVVKRISHHDLIDLVDVPAMVLSVHV